MVKVSWGVQVTRPCPTISPGPGTLSCRLCWANLAAELACKQRKKMQMKKKVTEREEEEEGEEMQKAGIRKSNVTETSTCKFL